jgi:Arc/MetJ family transcription regulator
MMVRMKRISVTLDESLLQEAKEAFGCNSDSAAVNAALAEVLRVQTIQGYPRAGNPENVERDTNQRPTAVIDRKTRKV